MTRELCARWVASAPGKLVLGGEYAVLEGAPAIVAAVQVRATVRLASMRDASRGGSRLAPEVQATRRLVESELGSVEGELAIDVSLLRAGDHKLGVGSSAAAAVATAALLAHAHGLDVGSNRDRIFGWAYRGHAEVAPRGSGVDVAASTHGGVRRCTRDEHGLSSLPIPWPAGLAASVVFTGASARTSDLLDCVHALAERDPSAHRLALDRLHARADAFARGFESGDARAVLEATRTYHDAMDALGRAANAPIVESRLASIAEIAREHGGAAKPSGAGGGDVAIAFFETQTARRLFESAVERAGFAIVDVALGGEGAVVRED